jgi:single-strand DNA-binding protein
MYHTIIIVGNLGRDPEMRYTPSGQAVTNFSVAVNDNYTASNGEKVERTIWIRVSTWGKQAEICNQYLKKGRKVLVEGRLVPDSSTGGPRIWTRQDGTPAASFEVSASTVRFLSSARESEEGGYSSGDFGPTSTMNEHDDQIPF